MRALIEIAKELYTYRPLILALVKRHLAMRYRGSMLGFLWSFLNPLCLMLVYTLVFSFYMRFDSMDNYAVFLFCGLLPWICFSSGLIEGTASITSSGHLITKSMFPAHLLPAVSVIINLVNFVLSLPMLFIFVLIAGIPLHLSLLFLPVVIVIQCLFTFGLTLLFGALNVQFRDTQHLIGNFLTLFFFLCPILYPMTTIPERFRFTVIFNPIGQLTLFYQDLILRGVMPSFKAFGFVVVITAVVLVVGATVYDKRKESFAELV